MRSQTEHFGTRGGSCGIPVAQRDALESVRQIMVGWLVGVTMNEGCGMGAVQPLTAGLGIQVGIAGDALLEMFALSAQGARSGLALRQCLA